MSTWRDSLPKKRPMGFIAACLLSLVACVFYPSDLASYRTNLNAEGPFWVEPTETKLRFVNTIAQIGLPLLLRDKEGMVQLLTLAVATTVATQGLKRVVNDIEVGGTRIGERPYAPDSRHNMPSGHSSMSSCAVYFVARRYGWRHLFYLVPILLLTMGARLMLDAHTLSAVLAGCLIGIICAAWFTSPYRKKKPEETPT
ncbi:MAG: lipid A 1-phosphatase LpxE [Sideroxydans sp.]|nr:lipid A 1-phosphatase LpxE [Sideroxydans sp.]